MGAKLVCTLATNGKPDKNAIDDLIAGFEDAYGPNERDVNLWKAYFRGHAEFITVDQAILDANERERVARQSQRPPGAGRATRADDVSSDSEEEDCAFDPLVVVRTSSEGRMLSKWLDAARKRRRLVDRRHRRAAFIFRPIYGIERVFIKHGWC